MPESSANPASIREAMEITPAAFQPEKAVGVTACIQYEFGGPEPGSWVVRIDEGRCTVEQGSAGQPDLTIRASSDVWLRIMRRELDATMAFMTGQFTYSGDMGILMQMRSWFGR